jgi:hypothetical protein
LKYLSYLDYLSPYVVIILHLCGVIQTRALCL